jgi:hypothetical protein
MDHGSNVLAKNHQRRMIASRNQKCNPALDRISGMKHAAQLGLHRRGQTGRCIGRRGYGHRRKLCGIQRVVVMMRLSPRGKLESHAREQIFQPGSLRPIPGARRFHLLPRFFSAHDFCNCDFHVVKFVAAVVLIAENDDDLEGQADGLGIGSRGPAFLGANSRIKSQRKGKDQKGSARFAWIHGRLDGPIRKGAEKAQAFPTKIVGKT